MKLLKGKSRRSRLFALLTLGVIAVLLCVNFVFTFFGLRSTAFVDLTPEGLYTLSDAMVKECGFLSELGEDEVTITFCNDPDYLIDQTVTRVTYFMALKLHQKFKNVRVETVNVQMNPTAVAKYKASSLSKILPTDVIVSYGDRYRIVGAANFWTTGSTGQFFSYNGEYKMASILKSVTLANEKRPTAYFVTDHGETYYDPKNPTSEMSLAASELAALLYEAGLGIDTIEISKKEIPANCALLIINNPRTDFATSPDEYDNFDYISDVEKLDRYMVKNQGAMLVAKDYKIELPVFEDFLNEWGLKVSHSQVKDPEGSLAGSADPYTDLIAEYDKSPESYGYAIYGSYASLDSSPRMVIPNTGYISSSFGESNMITEPGTGDVSRRYCKFLMASSTARAYSKSPLTGEYNELADKRGGYALAGVSVRSDFDSHSAETVYSYLFCANSADFFSNTTLGNASFANYDVTASLVNNISRVDYYASLELGGTSVNSSSYGGKQLISTELSVEDTNVYSPDASEIIKVNKGLGTGAKVAYSIIIGLVPLALVIVGTVVCVRRKFK